MTRRTPLTIRTIPLFADDDELGEVILGFDRRRKFRTLAQVCERQGMPKFSEFWGGRYVPAVLAFLEKEYGWRDGYAGRDRVVDEGLHGPRNRLRSSREIEAMLASPTNERELYRKGKVRVRNPEWGDTWIEDAKPTDPKSWQKNDEPPPAPQKRKLTPRTPPERT